MEITDTFTVPVTAARLWEVLTDVERIAPCVPGFKLEEANDPDYRGSMKIKVGAITMQYDATITFVERDDAARRVVLSVRGKERRGPGSVNAKVTSSLVDKGHETTAEMVTDVQVTGRVAQFGRGIIADVSSRMTDQFVTCLNERVLSGPLPSPTPAAEPDTAAASTGDGRAASSGDVAPTTAEEPEALNLGAVTAVPVLKRVGPVLLGLGLLVVVARLVRRR
jgi:carbon monoxide dehydrogenase subunit G